MKGEGRVLVTEDMRRDVSPLTLQTQETPQPLVTRAAKVQAHRGAYASPHGEKLARPPLDSLGARMVDPCDSELKVSPLPLASLLREQFLTDQVTEFGSGLDDEHQSQPTFGSSSSLLTALTAP